MDLIQRFLWKKRKTSFVFTSTCIWFESWSTIRSHPSPRLIYPKVSRKLLVHYSIHKFWKTICFLFFLFVSYKSDKLSLIQTCYESYDCASNFPIFFLRQFQRYLLVLVIHNPNFFISPNATITARIEQMQESLSKTLNSTASIHEYGWRYYHYDRWSKS